MQRVRDGLWNGNIPFGYCRGLCSKCDNLNGPGYCLDAGLPDKGNDKTMVKHPIDGHTVRMMYDLYVNGTKSDLGLLKIKPNDLHLAGWYCQVPNLYTNNKLDKIKRSELHIGGALSPVKPRACSHPKYSRCEWLFRWKDCHS